MKQSKEQIEAYRAMAQNAPQSMNDIIKAHLAANCRKYDEKLFDRCFNHLQETVLEMLGGQEAAVDNKLEGAIHADTVFRICRDYYDDEIWKKEDEEEAKEKAEAEKRAEEIRKKDEERKRKEDAKRKKEQEKKALHDSDMFNDEKTKKCEKCGLEVLSSIEGLCPACYYASLTKKEDKKPEQSTDEAKKSQLDMFAMFGGK